MTAVILQITNRFITYLYSKTFPDIYVEMRDRFCGCVDTNQVKHCDGGRPRESGKRGVVVLRSTISNVDVMTLAMWLLAIHS